MEWEKGTAGCKKRWEEELVKDYPEMVSRLGLLLEAGMSLRQAWKKLTDTYESKRKEQRLPKRAGYEEMLLTRRELEDGMGKAWHMSGLENDADWHPIAGLHLF